MATDIYLDPLTHDISFDPVTGAIRLTQTLEELTRQRLAINLKLFQGEWFADTTLGTPYFQTIYGRNTKAVADVAIREVILNTEGIVNILSYESIEDKTNRQLTVTFSATTETGEIITIEEVL